MKQPTAKLPHDSVMCLEGVSDNTRKRCKLPNAHYHRTGNIVTLDGIEYARYQCAICKSTVAIGTDSEFAYVKAKPADGKTICPHSISNPLSSKISGIPPLFMAFIENRLYCLDKEGRSVQTIGFQSDIWKYLTDLFEMTKLPIICQKDDFEELQKRAHTFLKTKKAAYRTDRQKELSVYPMSKPWEKDHFLTYKRNHCIPLPPKSHTNPIPRSLKEIDNLAESSGMNRQQAAGGNSRVLRTQPSLKLFTCPEPDVTEDPAMAEIMRRDLSGERRARIVPMASCRFLYNLVQAHLNMSLDVAKTSDGTPIPFQKRKRFFILVALFDAMERHTASNASTGTVSLQARLISLIFCDGEDEFAVAYAEICYRYTVRRLFGIWVKYKRGCCQDLSYPIMNGNRLVDDSILIGTGFEHVFWKFMRVGSSKKNHPSYQVHLMQVSMGHNGKWMENTILPDLLDARTLDTVAAVRSYCKLCLWGWATVHGEPKIASVFFSSYVSNAFGCTWYLSYFGVPGIVPSQNPLESLNRAKAQSSSSCVGEMNSNVNDGPLLIDEVPKLIMEHSKPGRMGVNRELPLRENRQFDIHEEDLRQLDGYVYNVDVFQQGETYYVNTRRYKGVAITQERIDVRNQISRGEFGGVTYENRQIIPRTYASLCAVRLVEHQGHKEWRGSCAFCAKTMQCCHAKYVIDRQKVEARLANHNAGKHAKRAKRNYNVASLYQPPCLNGTYVPVTPVTTLPDGPAIPPPQKKFPLDVDSKIEKLRKLMVADENDWESKS